MFLLDEFELNRCTTSVANIGKLTWEDSITLWENINIFLDKVDTKVHIMMKESWKEFQFYNGYAKTNRILWLSNNRLISQKKEYIDIIFLKAIL